MVSIMRLLGHEQRYFGVVLALRSAESIKRHIRQSPYRSDFVVLDHGAVWEILAKAEPIQRISKEILGQVDLMAVSPFELGGPVSDKMFFGRLAEEKTLTRAIADSNFAVVANRKIGKTSLLNRVARTLTKDPEFAFTVSIYRRRTSIQASSKY